MFANINYEYPVRPGVAIDAEVKSWGSLKPDRLALQKIADLAGAATRMLQEIGFP
jgi:iron(III) transport system substrate-binding protein